MNKFILVALFVSGSVMAAPPPGPYNQTYNYNQQYGSTNWYSSPLGMGVAQAGVTLIGGLVNAMSRPDPVVVQQPTYQQGYQSNAYNAASNGCSRQIVYDQNGSPRTVNVCQ